jgi:transposase
MSQLSRKRNTEIWSLDECHFVQHGTRCRMWVPPEDKDPIVKLAPTRKSISVFGAVRIDDGRLLTQITDVFNAITFESFMNYMIKRTYRKRHIHLILDNSRYHHAKAFAPWIESHKDAITFEFLPPYSPQLNPIERVWKLTRKICTHNRFFPSLSEVTEVVSEQLTLWDRPNKQLKRLCALT